MGVELREQTEETEEGIKQREEGNIRGGGAKVWRCYRGRHLLKTYRDEKHKVISKKKGASA